MNGFLGFNLTSDSISEVLARYPSKFTIIQCHHVTYKFNVANDEFIPDVRKVKAIGYCSSDRVECLVIEVEGETHAPDGRRYHLTLSHVVEAKPFESNLALSELGFMPVENFTIDVTPEFNPFPR